MHDFPVFLFGGNSFLSCKISGLTLKTLKSQLCWLLLISTFRVLCAVFLSPRSTTGPRQADNIVWFVPHCVERRCWIFNFHPFKKNTYLVFYGCIFSASLFFLSSFFLFIEQSKRLNHQSESWKEAFARCSQSIRWNSLADQCWASLCLPPRCQLTQ